MKKKQTLTTKLLLGFASPMKGTHNFIITKINKKAATEKLVGKN